MNGWAKVSRAISACVVGLVITLVQAGCGRGKVAESNLPSEAQSVKASLLTVSPEQFQHLRIVPVQSTTWQINVETTGTVDWDVDHTTQAITQVSGPITRIVVDNGSHVRQGIRCFMWRVPTSQMRSRRTRKRGSSRSWRGRLSIARKELLAHGAAAVKDVESAEADYNEASTDVQNGLQALKIFAITPQELNNAERQAASH